MLAVLGGACVLRRLLLSLGESRTAQFLGAACSLLIMLAILCKSSCEGRDLAKRVKQRHDYVTDFLRRQHLVGHPIRVEIAIIILAILSLPFTIITAMTLYVLPP